MLDATAQKQDSLVVHTVLLHPMMTTLKMLGFDVQVSLNSEIVILTVSVHCWEIIIYFTTDYCQDGDVRLVGGQSAHEGRVEVCLSQRWGTVTDDGWSTADAQVLCRQLGYNIQGTMLY